MPLVFTRSRSALPVGGVTGVWTNVTPGNVDLTNTFTGQNFGVQTIGADPANPGTLYFSADVQGIWKSIDYGQTWTGPVNTGTNGAQITAGSGGGITVGSGGVVYFSCIRGSPIGFFKSTDGAVSWTQYSVSALVSGSDVYPPQINPYNASHLLMPGHEQDVLMQSFDGGQTWSSIPMAAGMLGSAGTSFLFFIDTGNSTTTATTWLFICQVTGGTIGTWRTANSGTSWTKVDNNEHNHGTSQIYQPDSSGVLYMAGDYSALGAGILRSTDYGQTFTHFGNNNFGSGESVMWGTPKNVYSMFSWAQGLAGSYSPNFQVAAQPGTGTWLTPATPSGMQQGAGQVAVVNDGNHNILVSANWGAGIWRYIEP